MKFILFVCALLCCSWLAAQTKKEKPLIDNIEKQVLKSTLTKAEGVEQPGWNGAYKKVTVYFKKQQPVLIVQEEKQVIDAELTDGSREVTTTILWAKFYIRNWPKNAYIRMGTIENATVHYGTDKNSDPEKNKLVMPAGLEFTYNRAVVKLLMAEKIRK